MPSTITQPPEQLHQRQNRAGTGIDHYCWRYEHRVFRRFLCHRLSSRILGAAGVGYRTPTAMRILQSAGNQSSPHGRPNDRMEGSVYRESNVGTRFRRVSFPNEYGNHAFGAQPRYRYDGEQLQCTHVPVASGPHILHARYARTHCALVDVGRRCRSLHHRTAQSPSRVRSLAHCGSLPGSSHTPPIERRSSTRVGNIGTDANPSGPGASRDRS
mmetsp:Transcript_47296/g.56876  ORF Transcript_47296/g.56876 Transcript_47296/m.56876 type:complete len:214 (+) Transcript_47296:715-1356(+)